MLQDKRTALTIFKALNLRLQHSMVSVFFSLLNSSWLTCEGVCAFSFLWKHGRHFAACVVLSEFLMLATNLLNRMRMYVTRKRTKGLVEFRDECYHSVTIAHPVINNNVATVSLT